MLERVAHEDELILLGLGGLDIDALGHGDAADKLLAEEVPARLRISIPNSPTLADYPSWIYPSCSSSIPDLNHPEASVVVLLKVDVDGEMGVDVAHLVLEALGDANDHVVDDGADGAEGGDVLAATVVHLDVDDILGGLLEGDAQVTKVLLEGTAGALDGDLAGLDVNLDCTEKGRLVSALGPLSNIRPPLAIPAREVLVYRFRGLEWIVALGVLGVLGGFADFSVEGAQRTSLRDGERLLRVDVPHFAGVVLWVSSRM